MLTLTLPLLMTIAEESPAAPQGYSWDASLSRYRNLRTGRLVARTAIVNLLEHGVLDRERRLAAGTRALLDGRISPATWYARTAAMLKRQYYQNTALAAGGFDRLTADDVRWIEDRLQAEFGYLARFARQMAAGEVTEAQAANRMNMYVGHARQAYFKAERERLPRPERGNVIIERRILDARAENCEDCIGYQEMGWQREGVLPLPSEQSVCDGNCRCTLERQTVPEQEAGEWVGHGSRVGMAEYSPDQPRAPEGTPEGGQWVAAGVGGLPSATIDRPDSDARAERKQFDDKLARQAADIIGSGSIDSQYAPENFAPGAYSTFQLSMGIIVNNEGAGIVKDHVVEDIAKNAGISYDDANALVKTWAKTSGGTNATSCQLQNVAAERFGVKEGKYDKGWLQTAELYGKPLVDRATTEKFVNAVYDSTQAMLKGSGASTIRLYRGMEVEPDSALNKITDEIAVHASNPLSSWSLSPLTAHNFTRRYGSSKPGVVLTLDVPVSRIWSTYLTGPGCLSEAEVIVIGGIDDQVRVQAREEFKWWLVEKAAPVAEYSPDQPRAPKGVPEGGQWIQADGGNASYSMLGKEAAATWAADNLSVPGKLDSDTRRSVSEALIQELAVHPIKVTGLLPKVTVYTSDKMWQRALEKSGLVRGTESVQGFWDETRIALRAIGWSGEVRPVILGTLSHEIGHVILDSTVAGQRTWQAALKDPNFDRHTAYSRRNFNESFAESYMAYVASGGKAEGGSPVEATFRTVEKVLRDL